MFNNDITLAGTSTSVTYSLRSVNGGKSIRADSAAAPGEPRLMTISHQEVTRPSGIVDRHLFRLDHHTPSSTLSGVNNVTSLQVVLEVPRTDIVLADVQDLVDRLEAFTGTAGNLAKLINNEP